jgi:hypothetical protein
MRPQPQVYKILKKRDNDGKENLKISNVTHGTWFSYFQDLWSLVGALFNVQATILIS